VNDDDRRSGDLPGAGPPFDGENAATASTTGDPRVDHALAQLPEVDDVDIAQHGATYDEIHRTLAAVLDEAPLDEAPGVEPTEQ